MLCVQIWIVLYGLGQGEVFLVLGFKIYFCVYFLLGIEVCFGVDCIQLVDVFELYDREFDRIYFNFLYYGCKVGVVKNRELFVKFFQR